jgi:hypothetical protein
MSAAISIEDGERPLAAPVIDGLRHVQPLRARAESGDEVGGQDVADIGDQPVVATFDRLVLTRAVDAAAEHGHLRPNPHHQFSQRPGAAIGSEIHRAVDTVQQIP